MSEDLKRRQQLEAYHRRLAPVAVKKSWWDRFHPYRVVTATTPPSTRQSTGNIGELQLGMAPPGYSAEDLDDVLTSFDDIWSLSHLHYFPTDEGSTDDYGAPG